MLKHEYHKGNNCGSHSQCLRSNGTQKWSPTLKLQLGWAETFSWTSRSRVLNQARGSVRWKETEASKVFTYQGLTTYTDVDTSWTIMSTTYNHVRHKKRMIEVGMEKLILEELVNQEQLE